MNNLSFINEGIYSIPSFFNEKIIGKLSLSKIRKDLTNYGKSMIKENFFY